MDCFQIYEMSIYTLDIKTNTDVTINRFYAILARVAGTVIKKIPWQNDYVRSS